MKRGEALPTVALGLVALVFVETGWARFPFTSPVASPSDPAPVAADTTPALAPARTAAQPIRMSPVVVWSEPMLPPMIVRAVRPEVDRIRAAARRVQETTRYAWGHPPPVVIDRARQGHTIRVTLTQYCLQGTTRLDHWVREGIVAADPKLFPLAHYVELFVGTRYLGRFLVDDTGKNVHGATLDIWNPNCHEATRFGRQWGTAQLVVKPER